MLDLTLLFFYLNQFVFEKKEILIKNAKTAASGCCPSPCLSCVNTGEVHADDVGEAGNI